MNSLKIKKNDKVVVLSGKDKGKKGKVLSAFPAEERIVVQGANMVTRHRKPRKQTENRPVQRRAARQEHRRRVERPARRTQQKPQTPQRRSRKARADQKQHVVQRQIQRKHPVDVDHRHGGPSPLRPSL